MTLYLGTPGTPVATSMLASDVVTAARTDIGDTGASPFATDAQFLTWLSDGLHEMYDQSPWRFLSGGVITAPVDLTALTDSLPLGDDCRRILVLWLIYCYRISLDPDKNNTSMAEVTRKWFREALGTAR